MNKYNQIKIEYYRYGEQRVVVRGEMGEGGETLSERNKEVQNKCHSMKCEVWRIQSIIM